MLREFQTGRSHSLNRKEKDYPILSEFFRTGIYRHILEKISPGPLSCDGHSNGYFFYFCRISPEYSYIIITKDCQQHVIYLFPNKYVTG